MNLRRQAALGVFWTATGNWGYQLVTLVIFAILSRLLSPEAFGLVALTSVFITFLALVEEQGLADALVQRKELEPEHLDTAFWISVGTGAVLALVVTATSPLIASLVNEPAVAPVLAWFSLSLVINGLSSVQRAILSRELRFGSLTARNLISVVGGGIAGVTAAVMGLGVWSLVIEVLARQLVSVVVLWSASDWRPAWRFSRRHFRDLFGFGSNVLGFKLLRFADRRVDNLMIGTFIGSTALGFYVVAYRLLNLIINVTTSVVGSVAFPVISRVQSDDEQVRKGYYKAIRLTSILSFPAFLGLVVVAPEATRLAFGPQWDASVPVMQVLAVAGLGQSVLFVNGVVLKALGRPGWRLAITAISVLVLIGAFAIAVQRGITAVALALVLVTYLFAPVWLVAVHRLLGLTTRRYIAQVGPPFVASVLMAGGVYAVKLAAESWTLALRVPVLIVFGVVVYVGILWLLARPMISEVLTLVRLSIPKRESS